MAEDKKAKQKTTKESEVKTAVGEIPEVLTQDQALGILIQGVRVGQKNGAYSLEDAELLAKAVKTFVPPKAPEGEAAELVVEDTKG